jgi:hypothetical protein
VESQSGEFCYNNSLCCFSTSNTKGARIFRSRLSPETFGYTFICVQRGPRAGKFKPLSSGL